MTYIIPATRLGLESVQKQVYDIYKFIFQSIAEGRKVHWMSSPTTLVTSKFPEGHVFEAGDFLLDMDSHEAKELEKNDVIVHQIEESATIDARGLQSPGTIAFYNGLNCADFCYDPFPSIFPMLGVPFQEINDENIRNGDLSSYRLAFVPGGPDAGESYYAGMGDKGFDELKKFIQNGGMYIGSCAGSYLPLSTRKGTPEERAWLGIVNAGDNSGLDYWRTGTGFVRISMDDTQHPVTYGVALGNPSTVDMIYWEGPSFDNAGDDFDVIATFDSFIAGGMHPPSWDLSSNPKAEEAMGWSNCLTPERFEKYLLGRPAIAESRYGKGKLILFSPHPEFGTPHVLEPEQHSITFKFIANAMLYLMAEEPKQHNLNVT